MWTQPRAGSAVRQRIASQRGIALLIVLWGLVLLAVIAAAFTTETRTEMALARNLVENAKARALADAGVYRAISTLLGVERDDVLFGEELEARLKERPALREALMRRPEVQAMMIERAKETALEAAEQPEDERPWRADGTVYLWSLGKGAVLVSMRDEAGKIDLNAAPDELIQGLFAAVGLEESSAASLTAAIADFRDADDETHLGGAEADDYRAAGLAWGPKNKPFEVVEELHQVLGMTREVYRLAAPGLTVYSRSKGVDVSVAPAIVLLALPGVDAEAVEAFTQRKAGKKAEGQSGVGQMAGAELGGARMTTIPGLGREYVARSRGRVFAIRAEARMQSGAVFVREAVVYLTRNIERPFRTYAWKRGRLPLQTIGTDYNVPDMLPAPAAGPPAPTASPVPKKAPLTTTAEVTLKIRPRTARGDGDETPAMEPPSVERPPLSTTGRQEDAPATTTAPAARTPPPAPPVSSPIPPARPIARLPSPAPKARRAPSASPPAATVKKQVTKKEPTKKMPTRTAAVPAGYRVQLGAFESERIAHQEMARIVKANGDLLGDLGAAVRRADLGAKGVFDRVRTGPLPARKEARTLCASLSERKVPCFVVSASER